MIDKLPTVKKLVRQLQQVPFLASKNIYRVASYFLHLDKERIEQFCKTLQEVKEHVMPCPVCFVWQEKNQSCVFCADSKRDRTIICVVESWHELLVIERTETFHGLYHVLGGVISPFEGIMPQHLHIDQLIARINAETAEIIFAMNQTPESEATVAFIAKKLQNHTVKISCLAKGVPIGSNLEFVDRLTIGKALAERKLF